MIINFYKFVPLADPQAVRVGLETECKRLGILGTILLAHEGINAGLAGTADEIAAFLSFLRGDARFADVEVKTTAGHSSPFRKLHVRVKPAIVTFAKEDDPTTDAINQSPRLTPEQFKSLVANKGEEIVLVDTRNAYETDWGKFKDAALFEISKFSDFPEAFLQRFSAPADRDKTYLMYCTGGIRCEKAVPWALSQGFKKVYQLDGGIIRYLDQEGHAHFDGDCFVFDNRWALDPCLKEVDTPTVAQDVRQPKPDPSVFVKNVSSVTA